MDGYTFVRIEKKRLADIQKLYLSSFGLSVTLSFLEAKYSTTNFGSEYLGYLAYSSEGEPAAYYGIFPMLIRVGGESVLIGQSGDTMTSPLHRMKGLFVETAQRTYELAKKEGVQFVFGFPNENSFPGFKSKLGWEFIDSLYDFRMKMSVFPLAAIVKRFRLLHRPCITFINSRLRRIKLPLSDFLIEGFNDPNVDSILHDRLFFEYKVTNGATAIAWKGFLFFVKIDGELVIGDVAMFELSRFVSFIDACRSLGRYLYCHRILLSLNKNHWLFPFFQKNEMEGSKGLPIGFLPIGDHHFSFDTISFSRMDADTF